MVETLGLLQFKQKVFTEVTFKKRHLLERTAECWSRTWLSKVNILVLTIVGQSANMLFFQLRACQQKYLSLWQYLGSLYKEDISPNFSITQQNRPDKVTLEFTTCLLINHETSLGRHQNIMTTVINDLSCANQKGASNQWVCCKNEGRFTKPSVNIY